jgi:hypothetical protein
MKKFLDVTEKNEMRTAVADDDNCSFLYAYLPGFIILTAEFHT